MRKVNFGQLNNRGVSLVELIVVLGTMTIVGLICSSFVFDFTRLRNDINEKHGFIQLSNELAAAAKNSSLCSQYELRFPSAAPLNYAQASSTGGQAVEVRYGNQLLNGANPLPAYGLNKVELRLTNVKLIGVSGASGDPLYQGTLRLSAEKGTSNIGSNQIRSRVIGSALFSASAAGQVTSCLGDSTLQPTTCTVDPLTQRCASGRLPAGTCPDGSIATGYLNGQIQCRTIQATCPANTVVTALQNGSPVCSIVVQPSPTPVVDPPVSTPKVVGKGVGARKMNVRTLCELNRNDCGKAVYDPKFSEQKFGVPECGAPRLGKQCFQRGFTPRQDAPGIWDPVVILVQWVPEF